MVEGQQKKKVEIAKIKVKLMILRDDIDKAIDAKDFMKAQDLQLEIDDLEVKQQELNDELALIVLPKVKEVSVKAFTEVSF
jgi:hypothetical protein